MARVLRERIINELVDKYRDIEHCVFIDFTGLSVESSMQLRSQIYQSDMEFFVVKNSMLKFALEKIGLTADETLFTRPTAVVSGGKDPVAVCKIIVDWQKKTRTTEIKGGFLNREMLSQQEIVVLSQLPPRNIQLSQVLGLFVTPLTNIASLFNNTVSLMANLLNNHIEKMEKVG